MCFPAFPIEHENLPAMQPSKILVRPGDGLMEVLLEDWMGRDQHTGCEAKKLLCTQLRSIDLARCIHHENKPKDWVGWLSNYGNLMT